MQMRISRIWMRPEWKITADGEEQTYFDLGIIFTGTRG